MKVYVIKCKLCGLALSQVEIEGTVPHKTVCVPYLESQVSKDDYGEV